MTDQAYKLARSPAASGGNRDTSDPRSPMDQVHLFALCWNEAKMLPYFFRHYSGLVDKFFIFDNGSTDGSLELLAGDERVTVVHWDVAGDSFVEASRQLFNDFWKRSRGRTNWAAITELDEHLYHPDLRGYLRRCAECGITVVKPIGYEMIADCFPAEDKPLWQLVTRGLRYFPFDKPAIFNPSAIEEMNYGIGRHQAAPVGRVVWEQQLRVKLLHYKRLGAAYVSERNSILSRGMRAGDIARECGIHYFATPEEVAAEHNWLSGFANPIPDLSGDAAPTEGAPVASDAPPPDEPSVIRASGLFDVAWYLAVNPDVAESGIDPLEHFCLHGWREGRRPNLFFDMVWYVKKYGDVLGQHVNPLLDYAMTGERLGRRPSPSFDPLKYRARHRLGPDESPLRHYLAQRPADAPSGPLSRVRAWISGTPARAPEFPIEFDPQLYLEANPDVAAAGVDPTQHYLQYGKAEGRRLRLPKRAMAKRAFGQRGLAPK